MPTLSFLANRLGPAVSIEAESGPLMDVCDELRAPIDFSCRSASCGTCRVEVLDGADLLEPPEDPEREVLAVFGSPPSHRLACQAVVRRGAGRVHLKWVDD